MLPIDEFLPIMFDQHVNDTWKLHFAERNLQAWSAEPLLIFPTHYVGDEGYVSDTEDSAWLQQQRDEGREEAEDAENKGKRESYEAPTPATFVAAVEAEAKLVMSGDAAEVAEVVEGADIIVTSAELLTTKSEL